MQDLIELVQSDIQSEEQAFKNAIGAYQARKKLRAKFPPLIREMKKAVKVLNRAGISCKTVQGQLAGLRQELALNEEILSQIRPHLQPGYERIIKRKDILAFLEAEGK
ncbi:hypothetical protein PQC39_gp072 [Vibrio phage Vp_R1]|uniref:Uncharacterized protein n=1 Tax=Vibrio phage Vp_R1 TaxID=2059867 RepID=A0A2H5BQK5_9CAUD|nr:hypothetical protein PQC39_gp072 [Vibrio phage Vp_R1]AUG88436.1 hypothetical protein VPR_072 [Vibrio phage Vp_R1]